MAHRSADDDFSWPTDDESIFGEIVNIIESGTLASEDKVLAAELCVYMPDAIVQKERKKRGVRHMCRSRPKASLLPLDVFEVTGQEVGISCSAFVDGTPCAQPLSSNVPFLALTSDRRMRMHQKRPTIPLRLLITLSLLSSTPKAVLAIIMADQSRARILLGGGKNKEDIQQQRCMVSDNTSQFNSH